MFAIRSSFQKDMSGKAILSIFLFGVYPDSLSILGYFIIFAAALYMFFYNKKQSKSSK